MIGQKFNRLLVISFSHYDKWRGIHYNCLCECGKTKSIRGTVLKNGKTKSCGCITIERAKTLVKQLSKNRIKIKCSDFLKNNSIKQFSFKEDYDLNIKNFIYQLTNLINNKIYIGKTQRILKTHLQRYYSDSKSKRLISRAILKYGFSNFCFEILYMANESECLSDIEIAYIKKCSANNLLIGYNLTKGGEGLIGHIKTKEQLIKQSDFMRGKFKGDKNPFYGKTHSLETRLKISESNKRRTKSKDGK